MPPALFGLDLLPGVLWGNLPSSELKPVPREIGITAEPQPGSMWAKELAGNQPVPVFAPSTSTHGQSALCPGACPQFSRGRHLPENKVVMKRAVNETHCYPHILWADPDTLWLLSRPLVPAPDFTVVMPCAWVPTYWPLV